MSDFLAKKLAFAGRGPMDVSENEVEFWDHTSEHNRDVYRKMAGAAIETLTPLREVSAVTSPILNVSDEAAHPVKEINCTCRCCGDDTTVTYDGKKTVKLCDTCASEILISRRPMNDEEQQAHIGLIVAQRLANRTANEAGWYANGERNFGEVVALMHSELSEALEADRKSMNDDKLTHRDGRAVEFADTILRIGDTAEDLTLNVASAFIEKNRFNLLRHDHTATARAATNGKKY